MAWICLFVAGILEVAWAFSMKQSLGFTRPIPAIITVVTMIGSFWLLSIAMRALPLGTAYGVWTGVGAIGAFVVGAIVLAEPINPLRLLAIAMITGGIVLMGTSTPVR